MINQLIKMENQSQPKVQILLATAYPAGWKGQAGKRILAHQITPVKQNPKSIKSTAGPFVSEADE